MKTSNRHSMLTSLKGFVRAGKAADRAAAGAAVGVHPKAALCPAGKTREQAADRVAQLDRQRARRKELEAGAPKKRDRKPKAYYEDRKAVSCLSDKGWEGCYWARVPLRVMQARLGQSLARRPSSGLLWLRKRQELPGEASVEGAGE